MKYKWKEKELLKGLKKAIQHESIETIENYEFMLSVLKDINTSDLPRVNNDFNSLYEHYIDNVDCIEDRIFDYVADMFRICNNDDELFEQYITPKMDLTNKELIDLGYEIIKTLDDKQAKEIYKEITNHHNHLLHIVDDEKPEEDSLIYGTALRDYVDVKPYILLKRRHTVHDIETFIHEIMHSIIFILNNNKIYPFNYFEELEGRFGEKLTSTYLREHKMKKEADQIDAYNLTTTLYQSYMLYLCDVLFFTAKNKTFDLEAANKMIIDETPYKDTYISPDNIRHIMEHNAFYIITNAIDYMVSLELSNKFEPKDQFSFIKRLSNMESYGFYNEDMARTFDFYKDNNKQLIDEKQRLDKVKKIS